MNNTYHLKEKITSKLLDELDKFKTRMDDFNAKYNDRYKYVINISGVHTADINIKRDDTKKHITELSN